MKPPAYNTTNWLEFLRKDDNELLRLSRVDIFKATGRGGQKKNKTSNAIRLTFYHLSVTETQSRSRAENIKKALKKLRLAIAVDRKEADNKRSSIAEVPPEIQPYLQTSEIKISSKNPLFPIFVGFLFNSYVKNRGNWKAIGNDLGFTSSQVGKFLEKSPGLNRIFKELKNSWEITSALV